MKVLPNISFGRVNDDMKKILLTSLKPYHTYQEIISYMKKVEADTLVNNTVGPPYIEYHLEDIPYVWEMLKHYLSVYLITNN